MYSDKLAADSNAISEEVDVQKKADSIIKEKGIEKNIPDIPERAEWLGKGYGKYLLTKDVVVKSEIRESCL